MTSSLLTSSTNPDSTVSPSAWQSPIKSGRTVVFIDGGHVRTMSCQTGIRIAFDALAKVLCGGGDLLRVYYYDARPNDGSLDGLLGALRRLDNFEVRLGTLIECGDRRIQKGVDGLLALDLTRLSMSPAGLENAVIVAGDGDFCPAIAHAKSMGVKTLCASWRSASHQLRDICDSNFQMNSSFLREVSMNSLKIGGAKNASGADAPVAEKKWPQVTRTAAAGTSTKVLAGEVVDVTYGASASVCKGGVAIARSGSTIHALKEATVYLHRDVKFTGTQGFTLIPCA